MVRLLAVLPAIFCAIAIASAQTPDQQVTVTGCVVRKADYRASAGAGPVGPAGTVVDATNDLVLTSLFLTNPEAVPSASAGTPAVLVTYDLAGSGEVNAAPFLGQRVEISGVLKAAQTDASRDVKLRELEITSIKAAGGICPIAPAP